MKRLMLTIPLLALGAYVWGEDSKNPRAWPLLTSEKLAIRQIRDQQARINADSAALLVEARARLALKPDEDIRYDESSERWIVPDPPAPVSTTAR